jgi:shikimate dehydrogenase
VSSAPGTGRRGAAVLGSPISHSLSPALHAAAYRALGLEDWAYRAVECGSEQLGDTLDALATEGLAGVSLTMPLKRTVMPMLSSVDDVARQVGAANTVIFGDNGWYGANTDVPGMVAAVDGHLAGVAAGHRASILGAGATAAAAIVAVARLGFTGVAIFARRPRAAAELEDLATSVGMGFEVVDWENVGSAAAAPLVVSTTPAGSSRGLASSVPAVPGVLFDVIYSPWPTPLAVAWKARGGRVIGGLELLTEQAALQVELMTGQAPPLDVMREAGYAALH